MVGTCVVYSCTNRQEKGGNISFFHFPHKNPPVLKQWANAVNGLHWFPKDHSLICSVHFKESCFIVRPGKRGRLLKDGAVPTEFPTHASHLQHQTRKRKSPKKRDIQEPLMNESPSKVKKRIVNEHSYSAPKMSPSKTIKKLSTQVRTLQQKVRRRNKKIKSIKQLLNTLKREQLVDSEQNALLHNNFGNMAKELFNNQLKNASCSSGQSRRYADEIKQFALTLHYYSPKAYDFVCKILALPHPSSIRAWGASVDCSPGYLTNTIEMLGAAVAKKSWMSDVVLIVDAMSLRKGTVWDPVSKKYVGTVDYGTTLPESPDNLATEALVFMIVGVSGLFKHPIAYVLQDKCPGIVQAQLITDCLSLLHGVGINVIAVVFDGCPANITTAKHLGCKLKVDEIQPWF